MTMRERGRRSPRLERLDVAPAGDHQPGGALVGGSQQFETLEAVVAVDSSCPRSKPLGDFFAHLGGYGQRVDLDHGHGVDDARLG